MFTLDQIKAAHSKVKSGADFPAYIKEIKQLGVTYYETFVSDGHTDFFGANEYKNSSMPKYDAIKIEETASPDQFKQDLIAHQKGKTDFLTFCNDCAKSGIEKWAVDMHKMTCSYYDKAGKDVLEENIPVV